MPTSAEVVRQAFDDWMSGAGYVASIFAPGMKWEITGRSAVSAKYSSAAEFRDKVLQPFAQRFSHDNPFRPVAIHGCYADGDTVIVVWDGAGTTIEGTIYRNTYAWIMTLKDGLIVNGTAFYDSIAFNELWQIAPRSG